MKKIHALVMSLIMLFIVLAPAQNVEAAGKSLKVSEKAFFKEMKEFDYKGMNRYVKDWGEGGQLVSAFYMVPSGKKYFAKCASKMSYRIISTKKKGNKAEVEETDENEQERSSHQQPGESEVPLCELRGFYI